MKSFPLALFLAACGTDEPSDTDPVAPDTDLEDTDVAGPAWTTCDGTLDLGETASVGNQAVLVDVDLGTPVYSFGPVTPDGYTVASPAGGETETPTTFSADFPAGRWVLEARAESGTTLFPTFLTGYGLPATSVRTRLFGRSDYQQRIAAAGWPSDPAQGEVAVYALDPSGAAITGATVSLGDATFDHAFIWEKVAVNVEGNWVDVHLPKEQPGQTTQGGALYYTGVCAGMTDVSVVGPCGACTLGAGGPVSAPVAVVPDALALSWWTCETSCPE